MCSACFSIFLVERRHEAAGLVVRDLLRERELWVVDIGMEKTAPDGSAFAARIYTLERFAMSAGVMIPIDRPLLEDVFDAVAPLRHKTPAQMADDRRFAEAIYRTALADGTMQHVTYEDPEIAAG